MVLTYDAYSETLQEQQEKESEIQKLKEKQETDMRDAERQFNILRAPSHHFWHIALRASSLLTEELVSQSC